MAILFFFFCLGLIFFSRWGLKVVARMSKEHEAKESEEKDYKIRTLKALERVSEVMAPKDEVQVKRTALQNLLEGNRVLEEKRQVRQAMKDELGVS